MFMFDDFSARMRGFVIVAAMAFVAGLVLAAAFGFPPADLRVIGLALTEAILAGIANFAWFALVAGRPAGDLSRTVGGMAEHLDFSGELKHQAPTLGDLGPKMAQLLTTVRGLVDDVKMEINAAIETSGLLSMNADFGKDRTAEVQEFLRGVRGEFSVLENSVDRVAKVFDDVATSVAALERGIGEQRRAIDEDTAAVENLIGKLREGAALAKEKRAATVGLDGVVDSGGAKLKVALDLVRGVEADAGRMLELIGVIDSIAESTNTLAINAAVQAARSGEAGRGFAVVAKEIRNLAEGARRNSTDISATLGGTIAKIKSAAEAATVVEGAFADIRSGTASVAEAFSRIDHTLGDLAEAGDSSLGIVERVRASSERMRGEFSSIARGATEADTAIRNMRDSYATLSGDTGEIEKNVRDLAVLNEALFSLGTEGEERVGRVARTVMRIRTRSGKISLTLPSEPNGAHAYYHELLSVALEGIGLECEIKATAPMAQNEIVAALEKGDIDCYWLVQTPERDGSYVPVEVVLSRGLVGKRVLFVPKGSQRDFDGVRTLRDFRRLGKKGGFGTGWFDVRVWQANGLATVEQDGDWRELFGRVARREGVDYLSRGANEIIMEAPHHPELDIERRLLFVYMRNLRYYLSRKAAPLKPVLDNAVRQSLLSGTMDSLMMKYFPEVFDPKGLDLENRVKIKLVI